MAVSAECLADPKASDAAITRPDCPEPERAKREGGRPVFLSVYVRLQGGEGGRGLERIEVQRSESEVVHEWNLSPEPDGVQSTTPRHLCALLGEPWVLSGGHATDVGCLDHCDWGGG
jgi:hypothetical protein